MIRFYFFLVYSGSMLFIPPSFRTNKNKVFEGVQIREENYEERDIGASVVVALQEARVYSKCRL